jgi:hypothetical protein
MSVSDELRTAMVEAYEPYVRRRLADRGHPPDGGMPEAVESGRSWLDRELKALLSVPFAEQRRGPLEVFQEALRFPSEVLARAGIAEAHRDDAAVRALPGDRYDLAPASSAQIGEEVWRLHLAWGAEKARAITGAD